jgi:hypothetical protein
MRSVAIGSFVVCAMLLMGCTTTTQNAAEGFHPPAGSYKLVVMRPDVSVGVLTAGGLTEPREDWTNTARENIFTALEAQQRSRGGDTSIARTYKDAGSDTEAVLELNRLHEAVGKSIRLHKYTPGAQLPTKQRRFDWTLGERAIQYGSSSGNDYALFLHAQDSFSSGGRVALQAVSILGCVVGVCIIPEGGQQIAFASLVDLHSGQVVWFNFIVSSVGDIREKAGAEQLVSRLLGDMKPAKITKKS